MPQLSLAAYIEKHSKTHLIFDFDATLIHMHIDWDKWRAKIRDEIQTLDTELWDGYAKRGSLFQNELVKRHGKPALDILLRHSPEFEVQYQKQFSRNEPLLQEVEEFKDMYHMYLWTFNTRQLIDAVLEQNGMDDWFEKVVTRNDVRYLKPNPEGFVHLYDPEIPEERYLLIGDSSHDRGAAEAAGIDFYHVDFFNLGR